MANTDEVEKLLPAEYSYCANCKSYSILPRHCDYCGGNLAEEPLALPQSIESALVELREMFPKSRCHIDIQSFISGGFGVYKDLDYMPTLYPHTKKQEVNIWLMDVKPANSELGVKMHGATLNEAMDQVRQWVDKEKQ